MGETVRGVRQGVKTRARRLVVVAVGDLQCDTYLNKVSSAMAIVFEETVYERLTLNGI